MEKILCLLHVEGDGTLSTLAREAVTAARALAERLGTPFTIGLVGGEIQTAATALASCGAARVLGVSGPDVAASRYASDAAAAEAVSRASDASIVIAPASSRWLRALPGAAFRLGGRTDTHVSAIADEQGGVA